MLEGFGFEEDEPIVLEVREKCEMGFGLGTVGVRRESEC